MEERTVKRKKKNYKSRRFWKIYAICMMLLIILVAVINIKAWDVMLDYEATQPEYVLDDVLEQIRTGNVSFSAEENPFEDTTEIVKKEFMDKVQNADLKYMLDSKSYDPINPIYDVLVNDVTVCKVTLNATNKRTLMAILTVYDWKVGTVAPVLSVGKEQIKITAPENFRVSVNGVVLDQKYYVGEPTPMSGFEYASEYVKVPQTVTYEIKGLYNKPVVTATDVLGNPVEMKGENGVYEVAYATEPISEELSATVLNNAKTYSNFMTKDLPGCSESVAPVAYMFPEGSYYLTMLDTYRREDMWMFSYHETPWYSDEFVGNYTVYSEDLFTVDVSFNKWMYLVTPSGVRYEQPSLVTFNSAFQYAKIDGNWLIVDIHDIEK